MITTCCKECKALGASTHRIFCDACGLEIGMTEDHVSISLAPPGVSEGYVGCQLHKACSPQFKVKCTLCDAEATNEGLLIHDPVKHGVKDVSRLSL